MATDTNDEDMKIVVQPAEMKNSEDRGGVNTENMGRTNENESVLATARDTIQAEIETGIEAIIAVLALHLADLRLLGPVPLVHMDKAKPNFNPSGLLAAETNTVKTADGNNTVLKYNEPPEARKPTVGWRLYVFKGSEQVDKVPI
ncbi:hypothetical protein D9615_002777 [Tricholomella constricta]|uniref:Uncharacterized protein n=1 Tax=Tricholomella constricta TaxID=117010 RepID=A0A8H5HF60_9AGAR|nr:hypothetical protein D9615_002777 [Tricholomella constricta]